MNQSMRLGGVTAGTQTQRVSFNTPEYFASI